MNESVTHWIHELRHGNHDARYFVDLHQLAGRLDILVNNADSPVQRARLEDCSLELWQQGWPRI